MAGPGHTSVLPTGTIEIHDPLEGESSQFIAGGDMFIKGTLRRRTNGTLDFAPGAKLMVLDNGVVDIDGPIAVTKNVSWDIRDSSEVTTDELTKSTTCKSEQ